jgi:iron complex transport system ATP-binding protein
MNSSQVQIEARALCAARTGRPVLHDIDLELVAGEWVAVVGPNGAGKSTLLRSLAGLQPLTSGTLAWKGQAVTDWSAWDRARWVSWMSQQGAQDGELTVQEVVRLGRLPHHGLLGVLTTDDDARVLEAMRCTEVETLAHRRLNELSAGECQRVLLARALVVGAQVLLFDEPISHLDPPHQRAQVHIWRQQVQARRTVVTVLHDLSIALRADRLVVMREGRVVAVGSPSEASLRRALQEVFDEAFFIQALQVDGQSRWVAISR